MSSPHSPFGPNAETVRTHAVPGPRSHRAPAPAPTPRRRWPWIVGITAFLVLAFALGSAATNRAEDARALARQQAAAAASPAPTVPPAAAPAAAAPAPEPAGPATTFGPGVYEVGVDVPPGKYKTAGPEGGGAFKNCYYARLKANDGSLGDIIKNGNSQGPVTVTIDEKDGYFETTGCQSWVLQQ